jgi:hypothetical protein
LSGADRADLSEPGLRDGVINDESDAVAATGGCPFRDTISRESDIGRDGLSTESGRDMRLVAAKKPTRRTNDRTIHTHARRLDLEAGAWL